MLDLVRLKPQRKGMLCFTPEELLPHYHNAIKSGVSDNISLVRPRDTPQRRKILLYDRTQHIGWRPTRTKEDVLRLAGSFDGATDNNCNLPARCSIPSGVTTLEDFLNCANDQARRRIEDDVESVQMRITSFIESGGRARDMADRVAVIVEDLEALKTQAVDLGEEEVKVDGYTSGTLVALVRLGGSYTSLCSFDSNIGNPVCVRRSVCVWNTNVAPTNHQPEEGIKVVATQLGIENHERCPALRCGAFLLRKHLVISSSTASNFLKVAGFTVCASMIPGSMFTLVLCWMTVKVHSNINSNAARRHRPIVRRGRIRLQETAAKIIRLHLSSSPFACAVQDPLQSGSLLSRMASSHVLASCWQPLPDPKKVLELFKGSRRRVETMCAVT